MKKAGSVFLALLFCASTALAQDGRLLPQWTRCHEDYACFTLEQTRELLLLEQRARRWHDELELRLELEARHEELLIGLRAQVVELETALDLRETRILELTESLNTALEEKNQWRAEAETPDVWPLVVGGSLALIAVGLGIGWMVDGLTE